MASSLRDYSPKADIAVCVMCLALGILSFVMSLNMRNSDKNLKAECTQSTTAVATSPNSRKASGKSLRYKHSATVTYTHKETGNIVMVDAPYSFKEYYDNEKLDIRYSPDDPWKICVDGHAACEEKEAKEYLILSPLLVLLSIHMFRTYPERKRKHGF